MINKTFGFFGQRVPSNVVTPNLIFSVDVSNTASYPGTGAELYDLVSGATGSFNYTVNYSSSDGGYLYATGSGYVDFNDLAALDATFTEFTAQVWWKYLGIGDFTGGRGGIYGKMGGINQRGFVQYQSNGTGGNTGDGIDFQFFESASATEPGELIGSTISNQWCLLTFVFKANSYQRLYENLVLDVNETTGVPAGLTGNNGIDFRLFDRGDTDLTAPSPSPYLSNGQIGAVYIYNRALSQQEIYHNYYATKTRYGV